MYYDDFIEFLYETDQGKKITKLYHQFSNNKYTLFKEMFTRALDEGVIERIQYYPNDIYALGSMGREIVDFYEKYGALGLAMNGRYRGIIGRIQGMTRRSKSEMLADALDAVHSTSSDIIYYDGVVHGTINGSTTFDVTTSANLSYRSVRRSMAELDDIGLVKTITGIEFSDSKIKRVYVLTGKGEDYIISCRNS